MKKFIKEGIITLLLAFILVNAISYFKRPELSFSTLPSMKAPLISGKEFNTADYHDKPLILHFWATWCPTCKLEISNFNALSKEYNVVTIAVQSGENQTLQKFMQEKGLSFPLINDQNGILAKKFAITAFPTTFIFDKEGKVAFSEVGYTSTLGIKLRMWWLQLK